MLGAKPDFQLLPAILVLLRPLRIVFPTAGKQECQKLGAWSSDFSISLDLMILLISSITSELTHTAIAPLASDRGLTARTWDREAAPRRRGY